MTKTKRTPHPRARVTALAFAACLMSAIASTEAAAQDQTEDGGDQPAAQNPQVPPAPAATPSETPATWQSQCSLGNTRTTGFESGLTPAAFAGGVADFLVERAEQEVSRFAMQTLVRRLCTDEIAVPGSAAPVALSTIFPHTCELTTTTAGAVPRVPGLGTLVRAVRDDVEALPQVFIRWLHGTGHQQAACAIDFVQALFQGLASGHDPGSLFEVDLVNGALGDRAPEIVNLFTKQPGGDPLCAQNVGIAWTVGAAWRAVAEVSPSVENHLVEETQRVRPDAPAAALFVGCVAHRSGALDAAGAVDNREETEVAAMIESATAAVSPPLLRNVRRVQALFARAQNGLGEQADRRALVLATWEIVADLVINRTCDAESDAEGCRELIGDLGPSLASLIDGELGALFGTLLGSPWLMGKLGELNPRIAHAITMVADVGTATTPEGVSGALERFAVGPGSWEHKHERDGFSLTGWAGLHGSYELSQHDAVSDGVAMGPMLSIGFDLHFAVDDQVRLGFYVPVIDVGNVANIRLANTDEGSLLEAETLAVVDWGQLFAPGLYAFVSLGRTPFLLGVGFNYVPDLRRAIDTQGGTMEEVRSSVWRIGLVLAVDVTIFPITDF